MKKCTYCGKEYPDEATVCTADGGDLSSPVANRQNLTGVWRGAYAYAKRTKLTGVAPVGFTLKLKQGWFRRFIRFGQSTISRKGYRGRVPLTVTSVRPGSNSPKRCRSAISSFRMASG